jgi:hypothetical protein
MKTIYIDYPTDYSFKTKKTFVSNEERTKYLHQVLRRNKVESPCHDYSDYVVEGVEPIGKANEREYWLIGS